MAVSTKSTQFYSGFTPQSISGLAVWLDAADSNAILTSGGAGTAVTQWKDKSANAYHATPLSGLSNAVVQSNYQNNRNVLNFTGNNIYRGPAGSGVYPSDVYIVIALKSLASRSDVIGIGATSTDNFNSLTFAEHTALRWHNGSSGFARTPNTVSTVNETSTGFLLMNWSLANNNFIIRRNGVQLTQTASYTFNITSGSVYQIGNRQTSSNNPDIQFNAYIGEIIMYNSQVREFDRQQIEGYLANKWGIATSIPSTHPYRYFSPFVRPFQPTDITNCALWLDGADASSMLLSGSSITQWNDKSGSSRNATQATPSYQPILQENILAGKSCVYFNGASVLNLTSYTTNIIPPISIFLVGRQNPFGGEFISLTGGTGIYARAEGGTYGFDYGGYLYKYIPNPTNSDTVNFHMQTLVLPNNALGNYYFDGKDGINTNGFTFNSSSFQSANPSLGAYGRSSGNDAMRGHIAEIIFYHATLTSTQRQQVEGYLASKWGIQSFLPTTQPFKLFPPLTPVFTPTAISGLTLWLDAADSTTLQVSGSNVTQWNDKSGNLTSITVATGTPTLSQFNGLPSVYFNGATRMSSLNYTKLQGVRHINWFVVANLTVINLNFGLLIGTNYTTTFSQNDLYVNANTINLFYRILSGGASKTTNTSINNGNAMIASSFSNLVTGTCGVYYNGAGVTSTGGPIGTQDTAATVLALGNDAYTGQSFITGTISECLLFTQELTTNQRQQIEGYLAAKWGLEGKIPASHPYKKAGP